jgi:hypothetical protein
MATGKKKVTKKKATELQKRLTMMEKKKRAKIQESMAQSKVAASASNARKLDRRRAEKKSKAASERAIELGESKRITRKAGEAAAAGFNRLDAERKAHKDFHKKKTTKKKK